jgi:multidrug efflux pump subunit AcrA (membrane-fusion protein)
LPVVPVNALVHHDENDSVFVVLDGHLVERVVQLGQKTGDLVAIADGVKVGAHVVVSPPAAAADGVPVE